ncbi:MAG: histidine kinase [Actinomycetota bacterium]|nr:histidine kinase [Actinomycetota bacterium]
MSGTTFARDYRSALEQYVLTKRELTLLHAYELGRRIMDGNLGVLDVVSFHQAAAVEVLGPVVGADEFPQALDRAGDFLREVLAPFDMAYRRSHATNQALKELADTLEEQVAERTAQLETSLEALREADEQRRRLISRLVQAQEEERQRLAAEIHDDSVQVMTAVGLRLSLLYGREMNPEDRAVIERLEDTVNQAIGRLRHLLFELRPPALERQGLAPALKLHQQAVAEQVGIDYEVHSQLSREPPLEVRLVLFRIAQEAIANIRKHAHAGHVTVSIEARNAGVYLRIEDDGRGFSMTDTDLPHRGHIGLIAMRERASMAGGWCRVASEPGGGTTVEAYLPAVGVQEPA